MEHFCCTGHQKRKQLPGEGPGHDVRAVRCGDQHVELKRDVQDVGEVGRPFHCFKTPIPKKLQGHEGKYQHTEDEQEEDVEDIGKGVPDASESPSDLTTFGEVNEEDWP